MALPLFSPDVMMMIALPLQGAIFLRLPLARDLSWEEEEGRFPSSQHLVYPQCYFLLQWDKLDTFH